MGRRGRARVVAAAPMPLDWDAVNRAVDDLWRREATVSVSVFVAGRSPAMITMRGELLGEASEALPALASDDGGVLAFGVRDGEEVTLTGSLALRRSEFLGGRADGAALTVWLKTAHIVVVAQEEEGT